MEKSNFLHAMYAAKPLERRIIWLYILKISTKERPKKHKCESSEKVFTTRGGLKYHIQTFHEKQRNYKCDSCGKSFAQSGYLKIHMKTIHEDNT